MARKSKLLTRHLPRSLGALARVLLLGRLLAIFLILCAVGVMVGFESRPDRGRPPLAELFDQMSVVSFRESPSDTSVRVVVELAAGGRTFAQYDVDGGRFLPPAAGRDYSRSISATQYHPLHVRGHVSQGLWLDVPSASGRSLVPEQFGELYRATLDFVKPMSLAAHMLGTLSGYSVGYRLGMWDASLSSPKVQDELLASRGLGRVVAREAWLRVLLEPAVMVNEGDATRFASIRRTQQLYENFFRLALNDSDGFIPREAARLAALGHAEESRAMLGFADAVRRAAPDSGQVTSSDFVAIERWASLLMRRGHWAMDAIPAAGEERSRYLGTLAWYRVAPPDPAADRVWVGPRVLVRDGETQGFVTDEIPATRLGCPLAWQGVLREEHTGVEAMANAWFADRPEFVALAALSGRTGLGLARAWQQFAAEHRAPPA
ncbi:MAG: hypothetical protein ACRENS_08470, partial [Candidatus Eiseniibacteriota bacterium]